MVVNSRLRFRQASPEEAARRACEVNATPHNGMPKVGLVVVGRQCDGVKCSLTGDGSLFVPDMVETAYPACPSKGRIASHRRGLSRLFVYARHPRRASQAKRAPDSRRLAASRGSASASTSSRFHPATDPSSLHSHCHSLLAAATGKTHAHSPPRPRLAARRAPACRLSPRTMRLSTRRAH